MSGATSQIERISIQSGITCAMASKRLVTLKELREGVALSVQEAKKAQSAELFWSRMLVGAKFIKATSNVILDVVGAFDKRTAVIKKVTDYTQKAIEGDGYGLATDAVKDIVGKKGASEKITIEETTKRADLIRDTVKGKLDNRRVARYSINEKLSMGERVAEAQGSKQIAKVFKAAQAVNNYAFTIYELVEEQSAAERRGSGRSSAEKTALSLLDRLNSKIDELEDAVSTCEVPDLQMRLL